MFYTWEYCNSGFERMDSALQLYGLFNCHKNSYQIGYDHLGDLSYGHYDLTEIQSQ